MFQSVLLILLRVCLRCLNLCLLSWTLGKAGEAGSDGDKGRPLERKTKPADLPHHMWGAHRPALEMAFHASTAVPLPLVRDLHSKGKNSWCCQQAGMMEVGKCVDMAFEGTRGCFIGMGLLVQCLPQCGHLYKVFYLCQKKGREGCPIVLRLEASFPSLKLWGQWGAALVVFFFHESEVG